ncbi:MAG: AlpA family transcriptional regulator [Terracidiphilus sp.]
MSSLLRLPEVMRRTGLKKTSLYARVKAGAFPAPIPLTVRCVAWIEAEVEEWIAETIAAGRGGAQ